MTSLTPRDIAELKKEILSSIHCALPGKVENYDPEKQTVSVRPAVKGMPLLRDVPVFMPASFEVNDGDLCLVIFADRDMDAWLATGEPEEPSSGRMHSLSDAFAFVGFASRDRQWRESRGR